MTEILRKTPLYDVHAAAGAKIIEFGGWAMPVQYSGILEEHRAVRERAGLFDVSHMGEIEVRGPEAESFLQGIITNDVSVMEDGRIIYSLMCNEGGGVVDDILVYRLSAGRYMLVVNASNTVKDLEWIKGRARGNAGVADISGETALLALQGPKSADILGPIAGFSPDSVRYYRFREGEVAGVRCLVSRTGYTGEDGFELCLPAGDAARVWQALMESGRPLGLLPAGLGARDTLRFEASLPLYGHELDDSINPLEAGLGRFVKLAKGDFTGREALLIKSREGLSRRLAGLRMEDRGIPRAGYMVAIGGSPAGRVTSGTYSPTLDANLAMAYLPSGTKEGDSVSVLIRGRECRARVVPMPFYKRKRGN
ncbi:MAG: glycine cleavage system aminomethyltransferase GcvT [Bacillota bacterium]